MRIRAAKNFEPVILSEDFRTCHSERSEESQHLLCFNPTRKLPRCFGALSMTRRLVAALPRCGLCEELFSVSSVLLKARMFAACTNFVPQCPVHVIPAQAGIQLWAPAFAGVTSRVWLRLCRAVLESLLSPATATYHIHPSLRTCNSKSATCDLKSAISHLQSPRARGSRIWNLKSPISDGGGRGGRRRLSLRLTLRAFRAAGSGSGLSTPRLRRQARWLPIRRWPYFGRVHAREVRPRRARSRRSRRADGIGD